MSFGNSQAAALALLAVPFGVCFSQVNKSDAPVRVSGRVIDMRGRPLSGVDLRLAPADPLNKTRPPGAVSRYDGLFGFPAVRPGKYKYFVPEGDFKITPPVVDISGDSDISLGDVVVQPDVRINLKPEQILVDAYTITSGFITRGVKEDLAPFSADALPCGNDAWVNDRVNPRYKTVEEFLGGKVRTIRAVRVLASSADKPEEVRSRIMDAWSGVFMTATCGGMIWSEVTTGA